MRSALVIAAFLLTTGNAALATPLSLGAASGYNVFTLSNFTGYNTDSIGKMAVGGDFNSTGFTVASGHGSDAAGVYDLVVGGNLTNSNNSVGGGSIYVGGTLAWNNPTLPNNAYVVGNVTNSSYGSVGGTIYYAGTYSSTGPLNHQQVAASALPAAPIDFMNAQSSLDNLSATLAAKTPNGMVSHSFSTYTLTGISSTLNVFNLTDTSYSGQTINLTAPAGSTVVVNVAGTSDSFNSGSMNFSGVSPGNVIFNFSQATTLALSSYSFDAAILAPFAAFTGNYGQINGQIIAFSIAGTTEFHDVLFTGSLGDGGNATPEPATCAMLATGLLALVTARGLRRRDAAI